MEHKLIVIDPPCETFESSKAARHFFSEAISIRISEYNKGYPGKIYPFGEDDFLSTHLLACTKSANEYTPVGTYKILSDKKCQEYGINLPILGTLNNKINDQQIYQEVLNYITDARKIGKNIGYIGTLAWNKKINDKKVLLQAIKTISCSYPYIKKVLEIDEILVTGIIFNNAYRHIMNMGFEKMFEMPVRVSCLNQDAYVLKLNTFSEKAQKMALDNKEYWDGRIHLKKQSLNYLDQNMPQTHHMNDHQSISI